MPENIWHNLSWQDAVKRLGSDLSFGLTEKQAKQRQASFGFNKLPEEKPLSGPRIFLRQLRSPLIYILLLAGIITLLLKEQTDSIVIFGVVALNTIVGFLQENKASQALLKLKKVVRHRAKVQRQGNLKVVGSENLVPGDIIVLGPGDKVPADGRLIEAQNLKVNEMALTGEWLPAEKGTAVLAENTALADRDNMVYMGTIVENGKARAVVVNTGLKSELGRVAEMVKKTKEQNTPLQKKISHFSKIVALLITFICLFIFIGGMLSLGQMELLERFRKMFFISVAVAVAAIPEGLPVAVTVILALGMQRILKRKGLVRKLVAAETLGSTSIIATDKTATLTEGKMVVSAILTGQELLDNNSGDHLLALKIACLCNAAFIENPEAVMQEWIIRGEPTDRALLSAGIEAGLNKKELEKKMPKIAEIPFSPLNKYQATVHRLGEKENILYVCGAPEKLLAASSFLDVDGDRQGLNPALRQKIEKKLEGLADKGLRVVAAAYKNIKTLKHKNIKTDEINNLTFVGFIGLKDPLRGDVKQAILTCKKAGMRPILVTGDHKLTARAVAQEIGLRTNKENIIEGKELDELTADEFAKRVKQIDVYARVEPAHKMKIIQAWQDRGEVVAMTGDGINDAPALRKADIGVALGSGTDVAKDVSDLILLPNSFSIIVAAIEEGRAIIDNIRKVLTYLLSSSFSEVVLIAGALLLRLPLPILAAQILWVNLIVDGLPGIALSFEPKEKDLMQRKPLSPKAALLTREMKIIIFIIGLVTDFLLLGLFFWLLDYNHNLNYVRTIIFACLSINSLFYVFSCKSLRRNLWRINPFSNKFLVGAVGIGLAMLLLAIYLPGLQTLLKTVPLAARDWLIILALGIIEIILIEATKWYFISKREQDTNQSQMLNC